MKTSQSTRIAVVLASMASCLLAIVAMSSSGCRVESPSDSNATAQSNTVEPSSIDAVPTKKETVTLEIFKFDDEKIAGESETAAADFTETFDVAAGTSLEEVMRQLEQPEIIITGSGATAFVKSIDGVSSDSSRAWTFTIDDEFSNVGIGSVKLTPPQTVRWRYTTMEEAIQ